MTEENTETRNVTEMNAARLMEWFFKVLFQLGKSTLTNLCFYDFLFFRFYLFIFRVRGREREEEK